MRYALIRHLDKTVPFVAAALTLGLFFYFHHRWYGAGRGMDQESLTLLAMLVGVASYVGRTVGKAAKRRLLRLELQCPNCGSNFIGATKDMIGDIGVCTNCKYEFEIGATSQSQQHAAVAPPTEETVGDLASPDP